MSIIQISRIQQRRGQTAQTGVPQLSSGEFGWSIDQQELYIGNGAVSEGAPAVGNTKIITEHDSNFFLLANNGYTYGGGFVPTAVPRTLQSKLDDFVNLNDFTTSTNFTVGLQRAINYAASVKKPLYIPEGNYTVTGTVYIPPHAELRGAGIGKTTINASSTASIFQTIDGAGNLFPSMTSGENIPELIYLGGLEVMSTLTNANSLVKLDCTQFAIIEKCVFLGAVSTSTQANGIELRGQSALSCDNVTIKDCAFGILNTNIIANYDMKNIQIFNNQFLDSMTGIKLAESLTGVAPQYSGPTQVTIENNVFSNISNQGIYVGSNVTGNSVIKSSNNAFINVGGGYGNTQSNLTQATEVIKFGSFGNSSSNDNFSRLEAINTSSVSAYANIKPIVSGPVVINSKNSKPVVVNGTGNFNIFTWPRSTYTITNIISPGQTINLNYTLSKPSQGIIRHGVLETVINGSNATITDSFTYTGPTDGDTTFSVDLSRSDAAIIKANNLGSNGVLTYTVNVRQ